ncbi:hypothetical protein GP486_003609 [Trichoglossum hirsutum]|uniref:ABC transporter domain-containing protein n=1 Tax=Trichoglossum hirsutum TaxID=265104 RepID=A0A9P8LCQ7_9PEZI|nr:hypothetical protein GP486_003609 [Trichoglossum hirsutum]
MDLSLRSVSPVDIQIRGLSVQFKSPLSPYRRASNLFYPANNAKKAAIQKPILDGVSADMPSGSLTAIVGASGSGKTTLLNTIAHRVTSRKLKVSGSATFNGNEDLRAVRSSYVMQQDVLLPALTVRETLQYAADLRLPPPSTKEGRRDVVEKVILELGLKECADTRIGNNIYKGCSGGEKRRTSIGVQMLANPSVLFCDEPTTGLDAYSAFQIVQTLKKLAETGRTVIISIHAPRSEIWRLFDRVILLSRGAVLYSGPADAAASHFQKCGYELPPFVNPAEFLIDLAAIDNRSEEAERMSCARVRELEVAWQHRSSQSDGKTSGDATSSLTTPVSTRGNPFGGGVQSNQRVEFRRQLYVLTRRTTKVTLRDPMGVAGSLFEATSMSIITGWIFWRLGNDLAGIRSREGALYTASSLQGYLILMFETYRLTVDIPLFDRERNDDVVSVPAFLLSRRLSRLFLEDIPVPVIFTSIYYFMAGFRAEAGTFFVFLAVMVISQYITVTLASLCVAVSRDFAGASLIANLAYTLQTFCCGYFIQAQQIPVYVRWLKWVSHNFYIFGSLAANEFIGVDGGYFGRFYACPHSSNPVDPACQQYVGRYIMDSLGLPSNWIWRPILVAISFAIAFFLGAWLVLAFWKVDIDVLQARNKRDDTLPLGKESTAFQSAQGVRRVAIALGEYKLEVQRRHLWRRSYSRIILNPITTSFEPGKINVIMGPSGCGKTSLLQSLARRLNSTVFSEYHTSGNITLNGAIPSTGVVESIASFVMQDDDALMSPLTVRETLRFAAGLRLPSWMSKREKYRRAEDVMLRMGLKDCADNLIGGELKKGISGGEKRRVSIAIQILTDPKVLLLDEPTSGLDAFTAMSVIDVLKALAGEGRTIIMTIHQARSDVFKSFDNVLLLARGGSPVYSGQAQAMLSHFETLGFECPRTTNPADFVLDLITVDLQHQDKETTTRQKVQQVIQEWNSVRRQQQDPIRSASAKIATPAELSSLKRQMNPFLTTFPLVLQRSFLNVIRSPSVLLARSMQVIGISILLTLFFAPLQSNAEAIQSRMGFIQEVAALYFVGKAARETIWFRVSSYYCLLMGIDLLTIECEIGMLQNVAVYPMERDVFYREYADGCYDVSTFLLSYTLLEIPLTILSSLVFGVLAAFPVNLKRTPTVFLVTCLNCFCVVSCGESIGIMFCTIFSHVGFALNITSILLSISTIMSGIMSLNIPGFLQALNYLSPLKYQVANTAVYAMRGQTFGCTKVQEVGGLCPIRTGEQVLSLYNLNKNPGINLMALGITAVVYRVIAFVVLKSTRMRWDLEVFGFKGRRRKRDEEGGFAVRVPTSI